ncbi:MAG TPA: UDP-2,3-diacylglucosamine diphosphatase, partial [Labilithrix sp.]|nr:UDP-2,3-diacylglucosamine diphosphatase [Labilithrix sp.]
MERAAASDIFVISDLHLGDGGARDNFEAGKKTPQLRSFLDYAGNEGGELFVLGDLFELWQMSLSLLFVKRREVLDHLASLPLVYVPGNHDIDLIHFIGTDFLAHSFFTHMRAPFVRELGDKRFRFFHGHEVDPFNSGDDPGFGRMLAIFGGIFEDQNGSPLLASGESAEEVLEQFGDSMLTLWTAAMATIGRHRAGKEMTPTSALTPAQNPDRLAEHIGGVRADLEKERYDVAVLGHTHRPGRIGDWYFNSGSWVGSSNCFLRVSPDGHVRYFEWKDGRGVELEMPVVVSDAKPACGSKVAAKHPFEVPLAAVRTLFPRPKKPERSRWVLLAQGALALALGIAALRVTITEGSSEGLHLLVTAFGVYALLDGALSLYGASREQPLRRLLFRVRGLAGLLLGLVVLRRGYVVEVFVILV